MSTPAPLQQAPTIISIPANTDLSTKNYYFCDVSAGKVVVASAGARVVGVIDVGPAAADRPCAVQVAGVAKVLAGGTATSGTGAAADANGKAVNAAGSANIAGIFLTSGSSGQYVEVLLTGAAAIGLAAGIETVSAAGAISTSIGFTFLSVDGTKAYTLADGSYLGQEKTIECSAATNTPLGTVTINDAYGTEPTTHVFTAVGQRLRLMWTSTGWKVQDKKRAGALTVVVGTDVLTGYDMVETYNLSITGTVTSTGTKALPNGLVEGEVCWIRCTTAASIPSGNIDGVFTTLAGAATTHAGVNATTDYEMLRWDGSSWQEIITNSVALT